MARIFEYDEWVFTPAGNGVIVHIDYNARTCAACHDNLCLKVDVELDGGRTVTERGCRLGAPLDHDGQQIATTAGSVVVVVQRIRTGAYRLSIRQGDLTGREVDELSRSYPVEDTARRAARMATALFRGGMTVRQVIDAVAAFSVVAA
jgi:hypothetical protein